MIFVILNAICYAEINEINDITSNQNISTIERKNKNESRFSPPKCKFCQFSFVFLLQKHLFFARLLGVKTPFEEFGTLADLFDKINRHTTDSKWPNDL